MQLNGYLARETDKAYAIVAYTEDRYDMDDLRPLRVPKSQVREFEKTGITLMGRLHGEKVDRHLDSVTFDITDSFAEKIWLLA